MAFLILFIVPFAIALATFALGKQRVIWQEFAIHVGISLAIAGISCGVIYYTSTSDTEIWNGSVTGKDHRKVSCEHSYCCQTCQSCTTDSKGHQSCHSYCCRTCYDHPYDVDWEVYTTIGEWDIRRVDRQGLNEPERWTIVQVSDPVSKTNSYTNYIKAAPDSLFRDQGLAEAYDGKIPQYPDQIYDYYKVNRFIQVGTSFPDVKDWNSGLSELNARVGGPKQANVIIVTTSEIDSKYYYALRQGWLGGKKNDIIVVLGIVPAAVGVSPIRWVHVMSWAEDDIFNIKLRDDLIELGWMDRMRMLPTIEKDVVSYFRRKPMADFQYLESSITPTTKQLLIALLVNVLVSLGVAVFVMKNDIVNMNRRYR